MQRTAGYYVNGIFTDNGEAYFSRWPLELQAFSTTPNWRIGARYNLIPELELDIEYAPKKTTQFDDVLRFVVEIEYRSSPQLSTGVRATCVQHKVKDNSAIKIDGDNTKFALTYIF